MLPRVVVDAMHPDPERLRFAADVIAAGGIVALPTDTLYALAVDPRQPRAVERLFTSKDRPSQKPIPLVAADLAQVVRVFGALAPMVQRLVEAFWPGPLTVLLETPPDLAEAVHGGSGRVGVRVPAHAVARALCGACGTPLTATSANLSGSPSLSIPDSVARALDGRIDLLVDGGETPGGAPSTIVDVTGPEPVLVRAGALEWDTVRRCLEAR